ncbi:MAG: DUF429 domain-containing protein [Pseudomonadota bacterium]
MDAPVAGIDGCKGGWLAVACQPFAFADAEAEIFPTFAAAMGALRHAPVVIVDMPIGLAEDPVEGRGVDREMRTLLNARVPDGGAKAGSRVFSPPPRGAVEAFRAGHDYFAINADLPEGKRLSKQAFNITAKIAEVDDWIDGDAQRRVREGHPELAFGTLTGQTLAPKKTAEGAEAREAALTGLAFDLAALRADLGPRTGRWLEDDLKDAAVLAWVAARCKTGDALRLPQTVATDARGLRVEVWF